MFGYLAFSEGVGSPTTEVVCNPLSVISQPELRFSRRRDRLYSTCSGLALMLALAAGATLLPAGETLAANSTCSTSGSTADCTDVPTDGIRYTSGISVVNVTAPSGSTAVNANTIGIELTRSGVSGTSDITAPEFTTYAYDHDSDGDTDPITVLAETSSPTTPYLLNGGYVIVNGDGTYTSQGGTTYANDDALAQAISAGAGSSPGGGGSVTVNNPGPFDGSEGASFTTTNADGIYAKSSGGDGGNGSCFTILLATWCSDGGDGSDGGTVSVNSNGEITVSGSDSYEYGVAAISQGGKGGNGGGSFGLFFSDAGGGGDGGDGGDVFVTLGPDSAITTSNYGGSGVYALSAGGNGGKGGSAGGAVVLGSDGGNGGDGGNVTVSNSGSVTTSGGFAHGIYAGSIGAGAGNAGAGGGIVAIGGQGGGAADGGNVTVANSGAIQTSGTDSHGIFAQSVGGGGGDGGDTVGLVGVGGGSGSSGDGGTVIVTMASTGSITTTNTASYGIFAQSVGGGGGAAGFGGGLVGIGGSGDTGGDGGTVTVTTAAGSTIDTSGQSSHGIFAQSIGGGGGSSGTGGGLVGVGAGAGAGGDGSTVTVTNGSTITTSGIDARGIFAQSIGGGGGSANGSGGLVAVGGQGDTGGNGGTVIVDNSGNITTTQFGGDAIFVQSIGGGGGSGAASGGLIALGGGGGSGGSGGTVDVTNSAELSTDGDYARGIFAQSVGGGGGSGGDSGGLVAIGGSGSDTSPGGTVTVTNTGAITTGGNMSTAIFAQSVGGGGGDGGTTGGVLLTIGGSGGGGGASDTVTVNNSADLTTTGDDSHGIFAQSIGGGGGNGGNSVSVSAFVGVAIGGSGDGGGDGDTVTVNLSDLNDVTPTIETSGDRSNGIFAQSVGGGGGNGGFAAQGTAGAFGSLSVAVGGSGDGGGDGGAVYINGDVHIMTGGLDSDGMVAQSIGGGGGNGGFAVSISAAGGPAAIAASVGVGGAGGGGGAGGNVTVDSGGSIVTTGDQSEGLLAQSVGGGGGNGGFSVSAALSGGKIAGSIAVGVGGFGGDGGASGNVDVTYGGDVSTGGADSDAIVVQAVGGGGGNGGFNVSAAISGSATGGGGLAVGVGGFAGDGGGAGTATADINGNIFTTGDRSDGLVVQSVGGGGGNGGFNASAAISISGGVSGAIGVGVGGFGGEGGDGNTVMATLTGNATTMGDEATAFLAQSIGGGGGNGGFNVTGNISGSSSGGGAVSVGVGGFAGGGGDGGMVTATVDGDLTTTGNDSDAFLAQSLGGGGGNGGFNVSGAISVSTSSFAGALGVGIGGFGGDGGDSDIVTASVTGTVMTTGDGSNGVVAQSLGGGGGNGGLNVSASVALSSSTGLSGAVGIGGFGGGGGDGAAVSLTRDGDTYTTGRDADGIIAQSIGGGGGNGGINVSGNLTGSASGAGIGVAFGLGGFGGDGGDAGTVTASVTGIVATTGHDSTGVLAQSLGGSGGNGGLNVSGSIALSSQTAGSATIGIGGFAGGGGDGDDVSLTRIGDTYTDGIGSDGIVAQSLGGGGGNGGINVSGAISGSVQSSSFGIALGLGGFGGDGGDAGNVTVDVDGNVLAGQWVLDPFEPYLMGGDGSASSSGILAQSIGGSGGNGAINVSAGLALTMSDGVSSGTLSLGVGGFGGAGGDAGTVNLTADAEMIEANGENAIGVAAQSIGGGGGNGGINISAGITMDGQITAGVGGFGGDGGTGDDVTATVNSDITVTGDNTIGFLSQSIGGGGGNGGINISGGISASSDSKTPSLVFGLGGFGGDGNVSGDVASTQYGNIIVDGANAVGVMTQSIGGGGGNGALNVSGNVALGQNSFALAVGVGGNGGTGANAGDVSLVSDGNITAIGDDIGDLEDDGSLQTGGHGILVQSIGGGGGNGGINVTGVVSPKNSPISIGVGGSGSGGGAAGDVTVTRGLNEAGLITTTGDNMNGLTAQSIGGGGGNGGINIVSNTINTDSKFSAQIAVGGSGDDGNDGGNVVVTHVGDIQTTGNYSEGLFAQSIGGGGGSANYNLALSKAGSDTTTVDLTVGGTTGDGGMAGNVTVDHTGTIVTAGHDSTAIYAQSLSGGGGSTGFDLAMTLGGGNSASFAWGQLGGDGGTAGDVSVTSAGILSTTGDRSVGIFAQSLAGGGGGSSATGGGLGIKDVNLGFQMGLQGGSGGAAGNVTVDAGGLIVTEGEDSHGIHAQSIGGGGGAGGGTLDLIIQAKTSLTVGIGGMGGTGGVAGTVDVTSTADILTSGDGAMGIFAQSIGGGGGTGGYSMAAGFQVGGETGNGTNVISANVGGEGGTGAEAGAVSVDNSGIIITEGRGAHGINAQSLGGGGGDGGIVLTGTLAGAGRHNSLGINVGGEGGTGGTGDDVTVTNSNLIFTGGDEATGIRAQSIGGGGGDAGLLAQVNITKGSDDSSVGATVNIGGEGGPGGTSGDVTVTNGVDGIIITEGTDSYGIFAQSIGGGGGNGSAVISANFSGGQSRTLVGVNIGGAGGEGGHAGDVLVENGGLIDTSGDGAHGIFAQSIGGGGGNGGIALATNAVITSGGGTATPLVSIGGAGGDGADAGDVTVNNSGQIITRGDNAHGIVAQSIGGQGGNANLGLGLTSGVPSTIIANTLSAVVGALSGGDGGEGGQVIVNHSGDITVFGNGSQAIVAESINGGGGSLVLDFNGITSVPGGDALPLIPGGVPGVATDPVLTILAGSQGRMNSGADDVIVNITGTIGAAGNNGGGFAIQSIGGGGGTVLLNLDLLDTVPQLALDATLGAIDGLNNNGANIMTTHTGDMITDGRNTPALALQSIGGGGGRANLNIDSDLPLDGIELALGSTNGSGEAGGNVSHTQTGSIVTLGDNSFGVFGQSVGGGGGLMNFYFGPEEPQLLALNAIQPLLLPPPVVVDLTLGANGGSGLNGGVVNLSLTGDTVTIGDNSIGQFHQSVGGGGGAAVVIGADILNVTLGGSSGAEGDGGNVAVVNDGMIMTAGDRSHGMFLQSVGGGGGAVFHDAGSVNVTLSSDNEGDGGTIRLDQTGTIMTLGDEAYGIIAQSIGGGGGWIDGAFAGSAGGDGAASDITLNLDGHVDTAGLDSVAVFAQSLGANGNGDIVITLTADHTINGGTGNGAGVVFDGGADNLLDNAGTVTSRNGQAVIGSFGNELIENTGNLIGNVELDGGTNIINNYADAFFLSLDRIWLTSTNAPPPAANTLTNEGMLTVYGIDTVGLTDLRGNYVQTPTGEFPIDVDLNNQATDRMNITGTGEFDGTGELLFQSIDKKFDEYVIAQALGGLTDNGFDPFFQLPTVGFDWMVRVEGGTDLVLYAEKPQFADLLDTASVDMNVLSMSEGLDDIEAALSIDDPFNRLVNLLRFQPDVDTLGDAVASLTPSAMPHVLEMAQRHGLTYLDSTMECPFVTHEFRLEQGNGCIWFRAGGGNYERDSENFSPSVDDQFTAASFGIKIPVVREWHVGMGLEKGERKSKFSRNDGLHSTLDTEWWQSHATVGYQGPNLSVDLTVAGGIDDFVGHRIVNVPGFEEFFTTYDGIVDKQPVFTDRSRIFEGISGLARGESDSWSLNTRLRVAWLWGDAFQVRPTVDLDHYYTQIEAFTEEGVGLANLTYPEQSDSAVMVTPSAEFAYTAMVNDSTKLRVFARPGVTFSLAETWEIETQFEAAPSGLDTILIKQSIDDPFYRINAGIQIVSFRGLGVELEYGGMLGEDTTQHNFMGRVNIRY